MNYSTALVQLPLVCEAGVQKVASPTYAYHVCADIAALAQESFHILSLNAKNRLLNRHLVTLGLADATAIHPREVFRTAIQDGASGVIIVHNHPSGDPTPSAEDLRVPRQLVEAGRIVDIKVLDHVVIGRPCVADDNQPSQPGFLSMRESGLVAFV